MPSLSITTFSQSSSRPTINVQTGPIVSMGRPADSRRDSPRSTASATATACGNVNDTVALMLIPAAVASSMAGIPELVAGIFTIMFGARAANRRACSSIRCESRNSRGSVWIDKRPFRPFC